jgi:predicted O-methyltransferase YrrM
MDFNIDKLLGWLKDRDTPSYNGLEHNIEVSSEFMSNKYEGTKYSFLNAFKDKNGNLLKDPSEESFNDGVYGSYKFIIEAGYAPNEIEGGSINNHLSFHQEVLNKFKSNTGRPAKYVAEIGFNAGVSACFYLNADCNVVSFDLGFHPYCFYAKLWVDKKYPNKHTLINGSSFGSVPNFSRLSNIKFDIIFIDGDHTFFGAYWDIINCKYISHNDTLVILDNVVPHRGVGVGVYRAMLRTLDDRYINFVSFKEIYQYGEDFHDGSAVIQYNFENNPRTVNKLNYKQLERKILSYSLFKLVKDPNLNKNDFLKLLRIYKNYENEISDYVKNTFNTYSKKFKIKIT